MFVIAVCKHDYCWGIVTGTNEARMYFQRNWRREERVQHFAQNMANTEFILVVQNNFPMQTFQKTSCKKFYQAHSFWESIKVKHKWKRVYSGAGANISTSLWSDIVLFSLLSFLLCYWEDGVPLFTYSSKQCRRCHNVYKQYNVVQPEQRWTSPRVY